jgi:hypothetical protein
MIKLHTGLYTVPHASVLINVLKVYHQSQTKIVAKLQFVYKSGIVIETKSYDLNPENITHWFKY